MPASISVVNYVPVKPASGTHIKFKTRAKNSNVNNKKYAQVYGMYRAV